MFSFLSREGVTPETKLEVFRYYQYQRSNHLAAVPDEELDALPMSIKDKIQVST
jgi:hypothetical protein